MFSILRTACSRLVGALAIALSIAGCGGGGDSTSSGGDMNKGQLTLTPSTLTFDVAETDDSVAQMVALKLPDGTDFVGLTETSANPAWVGWHFESGAMRITVHPRELTPGTHTTTLDLCAPDSFGDCVDTAPLSVNVTVREAPIVTPASYQLQRVALADEPTTFSVPLDARHATWTLASDQAWLVPVQASVADARSAAFTVDSRALAAGQHTAHVQMQSSSGATLMLGVELDLAAWVINVDPITTTLSTIAGKPSSAISGIGVGSNGTSQPIAVAAKQDWLKVSLTSYGYDGRIDIHAEPPATMAPGEYTGQIEITAGQGATAITRSVDVNLSVSALQLAPSVARIDKSMVSGKPSLAAWIEQVSNLGTSVPWSATADQPWVRITQTWSGRLEVVLDPPATLPEGVNSATITIVAEVSGTPVTMQVPVALTLEHPRYAPSVASIDLTAVNGASIGWTFVASQTNLPSDATLTYSASAPWITFNTTSPTLGSNTGIGVDPRTLASGSYSGTVTATVTYGSFTTTATIPVSLTLTPATLDVIAYANNAGTATNPPTQYLGHALSWGVYDRDVTWTTSTPWLVLSPATTSRQSDRVTASMSPTAGLAPGTYAAEVTATAQVNGDVLTKTFTFNLTLN